MTRDEREAERAKRDREMQEERREAGRMRDDRYAHVSLGDGCEASFAHARWTVIATWIADETVPRLRLHDACVRPRLATCRPLPPSPSSHHHRRIPLRSSCTKYLRKLDPSSFLSWQLG